MCTGKAYTLAGDHEPLRKPRCHFEQTVTHSILSSLIFYVMRESNAAPAYERTARWQNKRHAASVLVNVGSSQKIPVSLTRCPGRQPPLKDTCFLWLLVCPGGRERVPTAVGFRFSRRAHTRSILYYMLLLQHCVKESSRYSASTSRPSSITVCYQIYCQRQFSPEKKERALLLSFVAKRAFHDKPRPCLTIAHTSCKPQQPEFTQTPRKKQPTAKGPVEREPLPSSNPAGAAGLGP